MGTESASRESSSPIRGGSPGTPTRAGHAQDALSDARLVEAARAGDDSAFAELVFRYERKLLRVIGRLVHDHELARDLAQETFWKVYHRLDRFDTARRFGPWLFRVGLNLCLDQLRRPGARCGRHESIERSRDSRGFDILDPDPRERQDLVQEVQHVLSRLPLPLRTILVLRDLEGFSTAEVAAIVGRQEATIRWRLARARNQFRSIWESRQMPEPTPFGAAPAEADSEPDRSPV
jgi:RNA polymerase sigma-70 factor (ECF subfamily)